MTDLIERIQQVRIRAAEEEVVASIPKELLENMEKANAAYEASGGCTGCASKRVGVHYAGCTAPDDLY